MGPRRRSLAQGCARGFLERRRRRREAGSTRADRRLTIRGCARRSIRAAPGAYDEAVGFVGPPRPLALARTSIVVVEPPHPEAFESYRRGRLVLLHRSWRHSADNASRLIIRGRSGNYPFC